MQQERDELIRRVFPRIRNFCERRGVILREVDLRWGIPQNEIDEGKLLPICLAEVTNCRPFFVCFLGDRYGTVIEKISEEILENEPWLRGHQGKSITELEILQGALNNPAPFIHAFFYLRRTPRSGIKSFSDTDVESARKLDDLKRRIRESSYTVREYREPRHLGEILLADLTVLFENLFPAEEIPDSFKRESLEQNAFAENLSYGYTGWHKYFDALDKHAKNRQSVMIVSGGDGCGKSSLLANWARRYQGYSIQTQPSNSVFSRIYEKIRRFLKFNAAGENLTDCLFITHFVGSTEQSSDWATVLRRTMIFLRNRFQISLDVPEARHLLPTVFANFLQAIPEREKVILVIDGIDKINIDNTYSEFSWLPEKFPPNVKLILSASAPASLGELGRRKHTPLKIQPLLLAERELFITNYLKQYRKTLDRQTRRQIASAGNTANPLYLRTFLEELRMVARQSDELNRLSEYYLIAKDAREIFEKLIIRLEKDFDSPEAGKTDLARHTLRLLWASHSGLSENELTELLGAPDNPLPAAVWSPFYLSVKNHLLNRQGLLTFFHSSFRGAVEKIYLESDEERAKVHRQIADYFKEHGSLARRIDELPLHLAILHSWSELSALLADPDFLAAAWQTHKYEVQSYWLLIEANSPHKLLDAYRPVIDSPALHRDSLWAVCFLLNEAGYLREVFSPVEYLESEARNQNNYAELQASLSFKAGLLKKLGDLDQALAVLRENELVCRQIDDQAALASCFGNQAVILYEKADFDAALLLHQQEEKIYRRSQDFVGLSVSLGNQALNREKRQDFVEALNLLREQEKLCRQLGDLSSLQKSLGNQALILWRTGETDKAVERFKTSEEICRKLNYTTELLICLGNQAMIFEFDGNYDKADQLLTEKEIICRETQDFIELAHTLWRHSRMYFVKLKQPEFALPLAEEALDLAERHNERELLREINQFVSAAKRKI